MKLPLSAVLFCLWLGSFGTTDVVWSQEPGRTAYERGVVGLSVTFQEWDQDRPWVKRKPETRRSSAVLVDAHHVLTTAQMIEDATFLQIETFGRARQVEPKIERVDRSVDLALLSIDASISSGLAPVSLAARTPTSGTLRTARWRGQQIEAAASRVIRLEVERSSAGHAYHAYLRMRTDMAAGGWAEPVFDGDALVGITVSQSQDESRAIPAEILRAFLERGVVPGRVEDFASLGVNWQINRDSAVSRYLGQEGNPRGILIRQVPWGSTGCGSLKPRDILLELGGAPIDAEGFYDHPWLGRIGFGHVLAERVKPGETIVARVLRDRQERELTLQVRPYPASLNLVPSFQPDPPPYLIVGGLVIRELDLPYLRTWGKEWTKDAPDSLISRYYYEAEGQTLEQRRVVLITSVLPSSFNVGYHALRDVVIDRVNGRPIGKIEDIVDALVKPEVAYHVIDLTPESAGGQIVLDAAKLDAATAEILQEFDVPAASRPRQDPLPQGGGECPGDY